MERMQNADQVFFEAFIDGRVISMISGNLCSNGIPLKISRPHPGWLFHRSVCYPRRTLSFSLMRKSKPYIDKVRV